MKTLTAAAVVRPAAGEPGASVAPAPLDLATIRADFPILATQVHNQPLVYLDSAASAQKL